MDDPGPRRLRYLWAYSAADAGTEAWHQRLLARRRARGYDVVGCCVTPPSLRHRWLPFPELHRRWRHGDPALLDLYAELVEKSADRDVLVLFNGANVHPDFAASLPLLKVYGCADDPESSEILSHPVAPAFDVQLVYNPACVLLYRSWGLPHVHFLPLGSQVDEDQVADLDESAILDPRRRPRPIVFVGERNRWRQERLDRLASAFPDAWCAGVGWPQGRVAHDQVMAAYRSSQLGWNVHNSTGPINFRTYDLPAHGIMQLCDNKTHFGDLFHLGEEAVGFDSIEECIDQTRYFLAHPEEQRRIALAGWRRWRKDYTPDRIWERLCQIVCRHLAQGRPSPSLALGAAPRLLLAQRRRSGLAGRCRLALGLLWRRIRDKLFSGSRRNR
jgi:hypothetical protein